MPANHPHEDFPREPDDIREDIAHANRLLIQHREVAERYPDDESLQFGLHMLENRLRTLRQELAESYQKHWIEHVDIVFTGPEVGTGTVSAWLLSDFLNSFQKLLHTFAQAILHQPTARGPLSRDAVELSALRVATTYTGSFGVVLETSMSPTFEEPVVSRSLKAFEQLVQAGVDPEKVTEQIRGLGLRAAARFRSLMEVCASGKASVNIAWRAPTGDGQVSVSSDYASGISVLLGTLDAAQQETVVALGRLRGVNLNRRSFEFYDEATRDHIHGKYDSSLEETVKVALDRLCRATFIVTIQRSDVMGQETQKWTLVGIDF